MIVPKNKTNEQRIDIQNGICNHCHFSRNLFDRASVKRLGFVRRGRKLGFYCRPPYPRPPFILCFVSPLNKSRVIRLSYQLTAIVRCDNFFGGFFILLRGVEMGWDVQIRVTIISTLILL